VVKALAFGMKGLNSKPEVAKFTSFTNNWLPFQRFYTNSIIALGAMLWR